jgi:hypothetical protein
MKHLLGAEIFVTEMRQASQISPIGSKMSVTDTVDKLLSTFKQDTYKNGRMTRLGNLLPIGLLLEAHYDFLKG